MGVLLVPESGTWVKRECDDLVDSAWSEGTRADVPGGCERPCTIGNEPHGSLELLRAHATISARDKIYVVNRRGSGDVVRVVTWIQDDGRGARDGRIVDGLAKADALIGRGR